VKRLYSFGQHVGPVDGDDKVQAVGFGLPHQRNKGIEQVVLGVLFRGFAEGFHKFGKVIDHHDDARLRLLNGAVVFVQGGDAGPR
jgi:hypothetical protein